MKEIIKKLRQVQNILKVPKNQYNSFGGYYYRSLEDILEGLKKILPLGCSVILKDEIVEIGGRFYVKATAIFTDGSETIENTAYAREEESKKGMDGAQITGASSSYARKYALNGLFMIDDVKDADNLNKGNQKEKTKNKTEKEKPNITKKNIKNIEKKLKAGEKIKISDVEKYYKLTSEDKEVLLALGVENG